MDEHKRSIKNPPNENAKKSTALAFHYNQIGHKFDFNNVVGLDRESNVWKLRLMEILHIIKTPQHLQFQIRSRTHQQHLHEYGMLCSRFSAIRSNENRRLMEIS